MRLLKNNKPIVNNSLFVLLFFLGMFISSYLYHRTHLIWISEKSAQLEKLSFESIRSFLINRTGAYATYTSLNIRAGTELSLYALLIFTFGLALLIPLMNIVQYLKEKSVKLSKRVCDPENEIEDLKKELNALKKVDSIRSSFFKSIVFYLREEKRLLVYILIFACVLIYFAFLIGFMSINLGLFLGKLIFFGVIIGYPAILFPATIAIDLLFKPDIELVLRERIYDTQQQLTELKRWSYLQKY